MSNKNKKKSETKSNEKIEKETFEMELGNGESTDEKSPEQIRDEYLSQLLESFPNKTEDEINALLNEMNFDDAFEVLVEEQNNPDEDEAVDVSNQGNILNQEETNNKIHDLVSKVNNTNLKPEVETMENVNEAVNKPEVNVEDMFNNLMAEQDSMQKSLEKKAGGVVTVDDTSERAERATEIAVKGKRKGKAYKPNKGTAHFMVQQNAKYKASGRSAPYSIDCIKATLEREMK